jgi:hypothetical protein
MRFGFAFVLAIVSAVLATVMIGCGGGGSGSDLADPVIRFVNASPDSNPQDFFINLDNKAAGIAFVSASAEATTKKGDKDISVQDSTNQTVLDALAFNFAGDKKYVAITVGLQNFGAEILKRLRLLAFEYNKNAPNGSKARLLVIHAFLRAPGFDTPNIDFQGGAVGSYDPNNPQYSVTDIEFGGSAPTELEVDSDVALIFQARRTDTENVYAADPSTTFDAGGIYLAIVTGVEGAGGVQAPQIKYIKLN